MLQNLTDAQVLELQTETIKMALNAKVGESRDSICTAILTSPMVNKLRKGYLWADIIDTVDSALQAYFETFLGKQVSFFERVSDIDDVVNAWICGLPKGYTAEMKAANTVFDPQGTPYCQVFYYVRATGESK